MTLRHATAEEDWSELDQLVGVELDLVLARRARPTTEPEVDEALFLDQATAFLSRHTDPQRVLAALAERLAPSSDPAPEAEAEAEAEAEGDGGSDAVEPPHEEDPQ